MIPRFCFVLELAAPGLLVIKHHRGEESGKFINVAVLEGDQIKVVDEHASSLPDCPDLVTSMLGFPSPITWADSVNVLVQLAVSMRAHGRGGALLVVPADSDAWLASIVQPIRYAVSPAYSALAGLVHETPDEPRHLRQAAMGRAIDGIAGLTAVDGAAILTDRHELLAFGAKIARRKGSAQVEQVTVTKPIQGGVAAVLHPTQLGGTRHLSAAQFVHDQRDGHRARRIPGTDASPCSRGRPVKRWFTPIGSKHCWCTRVGSRPVWRGIGRERVAPITGGAWPPSRSDSSEFRVEKQRAGAVLDAVRRRVDAG